MYENEKCKYFIHIKYSDLTHFLVETPLAVITALSIVECDVTSFPANPLTLSGWIGTFGGRPCSGLSINDHSGPRPGSGWTTQGHCCRRIVSAMCLVSLSCRVWGPESQNQVFIKDISILFPVQPSLKAEQPLPLENIPTEWCCHQHASLFGWYCTDDERCLISSRHVDESWSRTVQSCLIRPENLPSHSLMFFCTFPHICPLTQSDRCVHERSLNGHSVVFVCHFWNLCRRL